MLLLRSIKRVQESERLFFYKYINNTRFLSKENAVFKNDTEAFTRRFSKPLSTKESKKCLSDNFLQSLFTGVVNKSIFEYPTVLRAADNNIVLEHSAEVESFVQNTPNHQFSEDTLEELRKLELFGLSIPQKYGGAGYSETECKFLQECTGGHAKISRFLGYNENFGCKILNLYGTEEQKQKYLPRLAQGKSFISLAYLERGPLIDLSNIEGNAIYDEINKRYILSAEKKWVHNADKADLFLLAVKLPKFLDSEAKVFLQLSFFIVERDTPGLTIHKLKSTYAQENVFDVSFKEVVVQQENLLGNVDINGYNIIKTALSHNNVTDAAFCCNIIKHVAYSAMQFIQEGNLQDVSVRGYTHSHENIVSLTIYMYALESVIYFITGRFDTFENPDLFNESVFAKTLAVDILRIAIKKYIEILGRESFKSSVLLEEAIQTMQYYTVFDENIEYLKMIIGGDGLVCAAKKLNQRIKLIKNPFDQNFEAFKLLFLSRGPKYNFRLELQEALSSSADILEESFQAFLKALEQFFVHYGKQSINNEHGVVKFAEIATYLYALIVTLSRASSSLCYDFHNCNNELLMASAFAYIAQAKINGAIDEVIYENLCIYYRELGKEVLSRKEYPVDHPLSRTY